MKAEEKRDQVLESIGNKLPLWKARALQELGWMRNARLKRPDRCGEVFTFEDMLPTLEYLIGFQIPHYNLAGAVVMAAIRQGFIEETGKWVKTKGEEKHARRSPLYRWKEKIGK